MKRKAQKRNFTVEELLRGRTPQVRRWVGSLRRLVRAAAPQADERVYSGWRLIAYDHKGLFCYIAPLKNGVNLGFYRGARLPDPEGLLEGTGKGLRHVKIRAAADLRPATLKKLVRAASQLNAG
jgi:hypothetical protein